MPARMNYSLLGRSGLRVSELCLGTMTFGEDWGWGVARDESRRMFERFVDAGGNFIDTAVNYTGGTSERFLGEFIADIRDQLVVATKFSLNTHRGDLNAGGNHRKNLVLSLEQSLQRLGTSYVDLLWLHVWDATTPVEEVMRALDDQVKAGKVLHIGVSDTPAWVVARANAIAELRGWTPFSALQIKYSLAERTPERELLPMARALGLAVTPWGILGGGALTGKYRGKAPAQARYSKVPAGTGPLRDRVMHLAEEVAKAAVECGCTASQAAIAWLRSKPGVIIPILGARNLDQLEDDLGVLRITLPDEQIKRLDEASAVELGFPHDFINSPNIQDIIFGGMQDRLQH